MKTKKCTKCGEVKDVKEFGANRATIDGLQRHCRVCRRAEYAEKHHRSSLLGRFTKRELLQEIARRERAEKYGE